MKRFMMRFTLLLLVALCSLGRPTFGLDEGQKEYIEDLARFQMLQERLHIEFYTGRKLDPRAFSRLFAAVSTNAYKFGVTDVAALERLFSHERIRELPKDKAPLMHEAIVQYIYATLRCLTWGFSDRSVGDAELWFDDTFELQMEKSRQEGYDSYITARIFRRITLGKALDALADQKAR